MSKPDKQLLDVVSKRVTAAFKNVHRLSPMTQRNRVRAMDLMTVDELVDLNVVLSACDMVKKEYEKKEKQCPSVKPKS